MKKYLSLGLLIAVIFFFGFSANKIARAQDSAAGPTGDSAAGPADDGSAAGPADSTDAASTSGAASGGESTTASEGTSDASAISDQAGRIEALKAEFEARRADMGAQRAERAAEIMGKIDNRVASVQMRADKIGERIAKAQARILAVIEKVEARGLDASAAREHYDLSVVSYEKVKAAFDAAKDVYADVDPATTTREQVKGLRDAFRIQFDLVKEALKETQFHLKEAIKALKGLRKPVDQGDDSAASPTE
ncbi:hypothetical protein A3A09_01505 [Candidatus Nomurabacteria bacterium RIFCSPLOWO2_01_FULL_42_20]|uniref:DUF5667 domain-containing protein n=1 Tax=Candidatus Nomurabacteria bacterium RIFCSPHIGHO2_01_FULL_42_16 TaxID=1801743 RepID=A0A1F6VLT3_9BACT|nr:MAG: hypothetical protein A2824_00200 [Candidatus Nomurabacteria bacterium RIFCSPHIGHO2_01_FULL_42_16]OGI92465.1 MAG: hypothetical protein A3A09_01505 [Candidatus Nomurabacteria bacterium RIFCSPLOWO2_01_FULL_42_20]